MHRTFQATRKKFVSSRFSSYRILDCIILYTKCCLLNLEFRVYLEFIIILLNLYCEFKNIKISKLQILHTKDFFPVNFDNMLVRTGLWILLLLFYRNIMCHLVGRHTSISFRASLYLNCNFKYLPPFTLPFVLTADSEKVVMRMIINEMKIITNELRIPACPKIHGIRKNSITPHILSRHGTNTPLTHPNFIPGLISTLLTSS